MTTLTTKTTNSLNDFQTCASLHCVQFRRRPPKKHLLTAAVYVRIRMTIESLRTKRQILLTSTPSHFIRMCNRHLCALAPLLPLRKCSLIIRNRFPLRCVKHHTLQQTLVFLPPVNTPKKPRLMLGHRRHCQSQSQASPTKQPTTP